MKNENKGFIRTFIDWLNYEEKKSETFSSKEEIYSFLDVEYEEDFIVKKCHKLIDKWFHIKERGENIFSDKSTKKAYEEMECEFVNFIKVCFALQNGKEDRNSFNDCSKYVDDFETILDKFYDYIVDVIADDVKETRVNRNKLKIRFNR